jgi:hypothetical protein
MEREKKVDLFGGIGLAIWVALSLIAAWHLNGPWFARFGALGTAVAALYFSLIRHAVPYPVGLHEKLNLVNSNLNFQAEMIRTSLRNGTELAVGISSLFDKTGNPIPASIENLTTQNCIQHSQQSVPFPLAEWEGKNAQLVEQSQAADHQVSEVAFKAGRLQALVIAIASIQWGFGDLLFSPAS